MRSASTPTAVSASPYAAGSRFALQRDIRAAPQDRYRRPELVRSVRHEPPDLRHLALDRLGRLARQEPPADRDQEKAMAAAPASPAINDAYRSSISTRSATAAATYDFPLTSWNRSAEPAVPLRLPVDPPLVMAVDAPLGRRPCADGDHRDGPCAA